MSVRSFDRKLAIELLGAAAVVLSLVFVGFELRENALATKAEAAHNVSMALQTWYLEMGSNEQASSTFRRAMSDPTSLGPDEAFQFIMALHGGMLAYQDSYYLGEQGALDQSLHQVLSATLSAVRDTPGFRWYWAQRQAFFTPEFRRFVDGLEGNPEAAVIYQ